MTYLLYADAVKSGQISADDMVDISDVSAAMSRTSDGLIPTRSTPLPAETVPSEFTADLWTLWMTPN